MLLRSRLLRKTYLIKRRMLFSLISVQTRLTPQFTRGQQDLRSGKIQTVRSTSLLLASEQAEQYPEQVHILRKRIPISKLSEFSPDPIRFRTRTRISPKRRLQVYIHLKVYRIILFLQHSIEKFMMNTLRLRHLRHMKLQESLRQMTVFLSELHPERLFMLQDYLLRDLKMPERR